jgi:transposase
MDTHRGSYPREAFMKTKKKKPRRRYTEEFKREAVRLVETRGERTIADVAAGIGVAENLLHGWRQRFADTAAEVRQERGETPEEELKRLRREVARLKQERDILKKAAAFFAKDNS